MSLVAGLLDDRPMVRHGLLAAVEAAAKLWVNDAALIVGGLHTFAVVIHALVRADNHVQADCLPGLGDEYIFFVAPLDTRLGEKLLGGK